MLGRNRVYTHTPVTLRAAAAVPPVQRQLQQMLEGAPLPLLVRMAGPNAIAFFVQASVSMAEVAFVGRLGTAPLAALALMFPALMLMQMLANGAIGGAAASAVARALGAGDVPRAETLMWHALVIALVSGGLFAALFELFGVELLAVAGAPAAVAEAASGYATVLFGGAALLWLTALASALFRGMGNMKLPAALMVAGAAVQVPLAGGLILGWFGLPRLGLPGAAVAVVAVAAVNGAILLWRLARGTGARLALRSLRLRRNGFEDILGPGALASLSPVFTVLTIMLVNALVSGFGMAALAGYGIVARLEFLLVPMVFGIGAAMTAVVGVNVGAGNVARAEQVAWVGAGCAAAVTGAVGLLLALAPGLWLDLFTADAAIRGAGQAYLHIVGPVFAFQGLGLSLYFASQGAGSVGWPVTATVLRFVIGVGGAAAGVYLFGLGLNGVYASLGAGMVAYGLVTAAAIRWGAWRGGNADRSGGQRV